MNRREFLAACAVAAVATVPISTHAQQIQGWRQTLYIMDTWFWQEKHISIPQQAALLKKLGFGGEALSWGAQHQERADALKQEGLISPGCYIVVDIDQPYPASLSGCVELLKQTGGLVWLSLTSKKVARSDSSGDAAALAIINRCADECKAAGVGGIALYTHVGAWMEKVADGVRLASKARRDDVGVQFNQYHWMTADRGRDLKGNLQAAKPYLKGVSINGSDAAKPSILPLGEGNFDVLAILKELVAIDYRGPVSHQGYSVKGDIPAKLERAKQAWEKMLRQLAA